jgi:hypothetical protein
MCLVALLFGRAMVADRANDRREVRDDQRPWPATPPTAAPEIHPGIRPARPWTQPRRDNLGLKASHQNKNENYDEDEANAAAAVIAGSVERAAFEGR